MPSHTPDLDVSDVLDDPDFRDDTLEVTRQSVEQRHDGSADGQPFTLSFSGTPYPGGGQDLVQTPEGDHVSGDLVIITRFPLTAGDAENAADIVHFAGASYRVVNAKPYRFGQGFIQAACMLKTLNPTDLIEGQGRGAFG